ncbi:MAG: LysM peptidoglycan-binding domain-containing protein [Firmicutes bacterium]|nr:LysM peptidoglycan-binding domain-containing protein [Bacillota bacterium]
MSHRVPDSCPVGFEGRYTVVPGDTMFLIAQRLRINLNALISANPHITNPNLIFPGDVLCIPRQLAFPCCVVLRPRDQVSPGTVGVALLYFDFSGAEAVSVLARLPSPTVFGDFDIYTATALIPGINGFGNELFPTPEDPPTYSTSISLPAVASLTPDTRVVVEPFNTETGISGPVVLEGNLMQCRR